MSQGQTTLVELSEALQQFASSPRFNFLKTLQVGRFVGTAPISLGILGEFTFEKLVELGTKKIAKLKWLNKEQESLLVTLLQALGDGEAGDLFSPPPPISPRIRERVEEAQEQDAPEEIVSSVQLEIDLRDRLQELKNDPRFESLRFRSLGQFWDSSWPRAPFEESFTLEQLIELDMSTLFRKRTMSSSRIMYMTKALGRALQGGREASRDEPRTPQPVVNPPVQQLSSNSASEVSAELVEVSWREAATRGGAVELAVLEYFLESCSLARSSSRPLESALATLPSYLSGDQFLSVLDAGPLDDDIVEAVGRWIASSHVESSVKALSMMLQGPGVSLSTVVEVFFGETFRGANARIGAQVVARILGAQEVSIAGRVCGAVWSLNPELIRIIVKHIEESRTLCAGDSLRSILPAMDPILQTWLYGILKTSKGKKSPRKMSRTRKS
jgi:hypothetical protein